MTYRFTTNMNVSVRLTICVGIANINQIIQCTKNQHNLVIFYLTIALIVVCVLLFFFLTPMIRHREDFWKNWRQVKDEEHPHWRQWITVINNMNKGDDVWNEFIHTVLYKYYNW